MSKLLDVPLYLEAVSKKELIKKMIQLNGDLRTEFKYFDIQKDGKMWIAWFLADGARHVNLIKEFLKEEVVEKPRMIRKKG